MHVTFIHSKRPRLLQMWKDRSGLALTEFALAAPLLVMISLGGLELANYALVHLRISQVASNLADTVSRTGQDDGLGVKRISEADLVDAFSAIDQQAGGLNLLTNGRIILSSLEQNADGGQWIHWQRCAGTRTAYTSTYGVAGNGATGTSFLGMGPNGARVTAPDSASAVMFVEVKYQYNPLIKLDFIYGGNTVVAARAAFLVRDRRDLSDENNPDSSAGVTPNTC